MGKRVIVPLGPWADEVIVAEPDYERVRSKWTALTLYSPVSLPGFGCFSSALCGRPNECDWPTASHASCPGQSSLRRWVLYSVPPVPNRGGTYRQRTYPDPNVVGRCILAASSGFTTPVLNPHRLGAFRGVGLLPGRALRADPALSGHRGQPVRIATGFQQIANVLRFAAPRAKLTLACRFGPGRH